MTDKDFHSGEQEAQSRWNERDMWPEDRRRRLLWTEIPQEFHNRIENAPFFFLATSDDKGNCDCSFKGGGPGLVRVLDPRQFAFFDLNGNGGFMSLGNILLNPHVGCLFIDFLNGDRLRVNGCASILDGKDADAVFPGRPRAVLVKIDLVVPNCKAHVPILKQEGPVSK